MNDKNLPYKTLGEELKKYRGLLKKKDFAAMLGIKAQAYSRYEKGQRQVPGGIFILIELVLFAVLSFSLIKQVVNYRAVSLSIYVG